MGTHRRAREQRSRGATAKTQSPGAIVLILALIIVQVRLHSASVAAESADWPYRYVVSGPARAGSSTEVAYRLEYERVRETPGSPGFVFTWAEGQASFVSSRIVSGPDGVMGPMASETGPVSGVRWDFSGTPERGTVEVALRMDPGLTGDFRLSIYVPGTDIVLPPGSITSVTTRVAILPTTGGVPPSGAASAHDKSLVALGVVVTGLAASAVGWLALRRKVP